MSGLLVLVFGLAGLIEFLGRFPSRVGLVVEDAGCGMLGARESIQIRPLPPASCVPHAFVRAAAWWRANRGLRSARGWPREFPRACAGRARVEARCRSMNGKQRLVHECGEIAGRGEISVHARGAECVFDAFFAGNGRRRRDRGVAHDRAIAR